MVENGSKNSLSIIIPCYNEQNCIAVFYKKILKVMQDIKNEINPNFIYELIFVDDGSIDNTALNIENLISEFNHIHLIKFSRNFGKEAAILAGLKKAKYDSAILIDADLQHPPYLIKQMYEIWYQNKADMVYAMRKSRGDEGVIKSFFSEVFYKISNIISDVKMRSGVSDFRLIDRKIVNTLINMNEYHRFSKAMFEWVGFNKIPLEYEYEKRVKGHSAWSKIRLFKYAIEGIISFSTMPLKLSFWLGLIISIISGFYGLYIIFDTLVNGNLVRGYPTIITIILFLGGIQLIFLGIIGLYIARIYEQVKTRPHYIIEKET